MTHTISAGDRVRIERRRGEYLETYEGVVDQAYETSVQLDTGDGERIIDVPIVDGQDGWATKVSVLRPALPRKIGSVVAGYHEDLMVTVVAALTEKSGWVSVLPQRAFPIGSKVPNEALDALQQLKAYPSVFFA